ncbi:MAG TPA: GAF domain-containing protein [Burkholderiales bacterium]|nr:GAF domain-containing protein [Burkholderiales bacterium]
MRAPSPKRKDLKGTARAGLRQSKADPKASKLAQAQAAYKEALEQQKATADVLRAVSSSRGDAQPVFDMIARRASRLCGDNHVIVTRFDGEMIHLAAQFNERRGASVPTVQAYPRRPGRDTPAARAVLEGAVVHITDAEKDRDVSRGLIRAIGARSFLAVPMMLHGSPIGAIGVSRAEIGPFPPSQVRLLQTFADQAVIAIENARLFNEAKEMLERQTATAEVLRVISSSPTDLQPVFDAIAVKAAMLCDANDAVIELRDGDMGRYVAHHGSIPMPRAMDEKWKLTRARVSDTAILEGRQFHIVDHQAETKRFPEGAAQARRVGMRTVLVTPLMEGKKALGVIVVRRTEKRPFSEAQIELVRTFADQAVIAIENARLFNETKEALDQQTASSEILGVISASPTDLRPVFGAILENATRLCGAHLGVLNLYDGSHLRTVAQRGGNAKFAKWVFDRGAYEPTVTMARMIRERKPLQFADMRETDAYRSGGAQATGFVELGGARSYCAVPLIKDDKVLGFISVYRSEVRPFTEKQIGLVQTFASQAVIAIENTRLFTELQATNSSLRKTLEQQTATSEILNVISKSTTDVQPVLDTIAANARQLLAGSSCGVILIEDGEARMRAMATLPGSEDYASAQKAYPMTLPEFARKRAGFARVIEMRETASWTDTELEFTGEMLAFCRAAGIRSNAVVPMLRGEEAIGLIVVNRRDPHVSSPEELRLLQSFASQAVIAIENTRLFNETKESLERQTATAEILKVIAASPSDVQPVFDAIAASAVRVCNAVFSAVIRFDGRLMHLVAHHNLGQQAAAAFDRAFPMPPSRTVNAAGRAILDRAVAHIEDIETEAGISEVIREAARKVRYRTMLSVPMLREGVAIGAINVGRPEVAPFSDKEIALIQTFADQAVIAIENVRLLNETKEALERQTATAEILKVIAGSPSDVQPVFDAIASSAMKLVGGFSTAVFRFSEGTAHLASITSTNPDGDQALRQLYPAPLSDSPLLRQISETGEPEIVADIETVGHLTVREMARARGWRSRIMVPMMRGREVMGAISVTRRETGSFAPHQVELLRTFADQAVIAIENVRLFREIETRNKDLTEALEQQTATGEILKVISSSPTDVQPVFDTIIRNAVRLCDGAAGALFRYDGRLVDVGAFCNIGPDVEPLFRRAYPQPPSHENPGAQAIINAAVVSIEDVEETDYSEAAKERARAVGYRGALAVPMLREGTPIGSIAVSRREPGKFADSYIALLKTFADQAVIALENVRLFNETKEALERQTATAEILKVISGSLTDAQPVFDAIAESAMKVFGAWSVAVSRFDGKQIHLAAVSGATPESDAAVRALFPAPLSRDLILGRAILTRGFVESADTAIDESSSMREVSKARGYRSIAATAMLRDGEPIGAIAVTRQTPGSLNSTQVALLKTFADQAVIAIENVRLFNETKEALARQTATAEVLRVISRSPSDVQPVFEAIVSTAQGLLACSRASILLRSEDDFKAVAVHPAGSSAAHGPIPIDPAANFPSRVFVEKRLLHLPDWSAIALPPHEQRIHASGVASSLMAPLIRGDECFGVLGFLRSTSGAFSESEIALAQSFADQAVIAIENVRLFKELQQRTDALTNSVGQLTALGEVGRAISSTLDVETVLKTIASRAVELTGLDAGVIYEYDEPTAQFELRAWENVDDTGIAQLRANEIRTGEGAIGRTVLTREPEQVPDTHAPDYPARLRELLDPFGYRAVLAVPLLRERQIVGVLMMLRKQAGAFAPEVVEVLKTFGTQSAMAIQNARLYREIAEKGKQLEVASQHKSAFLASMSHELRTPLNAILGFNEMILDQIYGDVPVDMKDPLQNIQTSGKHLLRLINNVLDLAKIEAGRMELALAEYAVHEAVNTVHSTLKPLAADKGLEFVASVPSDLPLAYGDAGRISQCLMNLAGNSLKFTKSGKVEIAVAEQDGRLRYSVCDTGIGIPPEKIGSLFTEFKQTDATIASEYGGTGLGLSITKKFIEMHGGRIWVESELGRGSTFIFEVPLRVAQ